MARTRAGLLDGARRAVGARGTRRTTMNDIAAQAGVAKATLYNHFRTKDDVWSALVEAEVRALAGECEELELVDALAHSARRLSDHPALRRVAETEPVALAGLLTRRPTAAGWRRRGGGRPGPAGRRGAGRRRPGAALAGLAPGGAGHPAGDPHRGRDPGPRPARRSPSAPAERGRSRPPRPGRPRVPAASTPTPRGSRRTARSGRFRAVGPGCHTSRNRPAGATVWPVTGGGRR